MIPLTVLRVSIGCLHVFTVIYIPLYGLGLSGQHRTEQFGRESGAVFMYLLLLALVPSKTRIFWIYHFPFIFVYVNMPRVLLTCTYPRINHHSARSPPIENQTLIPYLHKYLSKTHSTPPDYTFTPSHSTTGETAPTTYISQTTPNKTPTKNKTFPHPHNPSLHQAC